MGCAGDGNIDGTGAASELNTPAEQRDEDGGERGTGGGGEWYARRGDELR